MHVQRRLSPTEFNRLVSPNPEALRWLWQRLRTPLLPPAGHSAAASATTVAGARARLRFASSEKDNDRLRLPFRRPERTKALDDDKISLNLDTASADSPGETISWDSSGGRSGDNWESLGRRRFPRLLALDVGQSYVGVAVSDNGNTGARPHSVLLRRQLLDGRVMPVHQFGTHKALLNGGGAHWDRSLPPPAPTKPLPNAEVAERLLSLIGQMEACALVVGLPFPIPGTQQTFEGCQRVYDWVQAMRQAGPIEQPIFWVSEAYSTRFAEAGLREGGLKSRQIDRHLDQESAAYILRRFLEELHDAAHY